MVSTTMVMITLIIIGRVHKPHDVDPTLSKSAFDSDGAALNKKWSMYNYVPVTDRTFPDHIRTFVADAAKTDQLSSNQEAHLDDSLATFFRAYSDGRYLAYKSFRFPPGIPFYWKTNKFGSMQDILRNGPKFGAPGAYDKWYTDIKGKNLDQLSLDEKFQLYLNINAGDFVYSNYFSAVSFDQSRMVIFNSGGKIEGPWETAFWQTNFPDDNLVVVEASFPNAGYFAQKERYTYIGFEDDINKMESEYGNVTIADGFFFIERPKPDPILPIIVRFYWDPKAMQWLPDDVVVCNMWNKGHIWPIF